MRRRQRRINNSKARRPVMRSLAGRFFCLKERGLAPRRDRPRANQRYESSVRESTGLMSTTGVPSIASRGPT